MLKALNGEVVRWLTKVCQVAWKLGKTTLNWQTDVIISICKKDDPKKWTSYQKIPFFSFPGKMYIKWLEKKFRETVESILNNSERDFYPVGCKFSL